MTSANSSLFSLEEYEARFDAPAGIQYIRDTWTLCLWFGGAYVILVHLAKRYMQDRPKYDLRFPLVVWSSTLAAFSIAGALRSTPEFYDSMVRHGFEHSVCNPNYFLANPSGFWAFVMVYSKFFELGDTAFIVLRKQPLIFLHWYHHLTVLIYGTYSYGQLVATGRWFIVMNFIVHSFMYTYYTLKAMRVSIPRWVSMFITSSQLLQMLLGIISNMAALYFLKQGHKCSTTTNDVLIAFALYATYLVLFANFFYSSYMKPKPKEKSASALQTNGHSKMGRTSNGMDRH